MSAGIKLALLLLLGLAGDARLLRAQRDVENPYYGLLVIPPYDEEAEVFREYILVKMPLPYLLVRRPDPPVPGYFAWRVSFGNDSTSTVVLATDSAVATKSNREILRASTLRRCPPSAMWVLQCTRVIKGSARLTGDLLIIEIRDPEFVALIRARAPRLLLRHVLEPGGRLRVDHVGIKYSGEPLRPR